MVLCGCRTQLSAVVTLLTKTRSCWDLSAMSIVGRITPSTRSMSAEPTFNDSARVLTSPAVGGPPFLEITTLLPFQI
jgi:hypothetical protein